MLQRAVHQLTLAPVPRAQPRLPVWTSGRTTPVSVPRGPSVQTVSTSVPTSIPVRTWLTVAIPRVGAISVSVGAYSLGTIVRMLLSNLVQQSGGVTQCVVLVMRTVPERMDSTPAVIKQRENAHVW